MLSQGAYALKILEKASMAGCNSHQAPLEHCLKLSKNISEPLLDATKYHSLVGSLRYLVNTCLDLAFSVGYVSISRDDKVNLTKCQHHHQYSVVFDTWTEWGQTLGQMGPGPNSGKIKILAGNLEEGLLTALTAIEMGILKHLVQILHFPIAVGKMAIGQWHALP
jgi:hypothetical protein